MAHVTFLVSTIILRNTGLKKIYVNIINININQVIINIDSQKVTIFSGRGWHGLMVVVYSFSLEFKIKLNNNKNETENH